MKPLPLKSQCISFTVQTRPPSPKVKPPPEQWKKAGRPVAEAPSTMVPLHSGSAIFISTIDLVSIYTPKAALYTARLIDVIFGRQTLLKACVSRTENSGDLVPLDEDKLKSVIVHVVHVFKKQNVEVSESLVLGYIRNRLCYLQSSKKNGFPF
ncbi:uncharacterized protein LOC134285805 isoform X1 [Aedes albopictus]|uniref:BEN domain-containing protein n=1 Tax=Aedes albopictus TaxID=7160 RepID=A0ABM1Y9A4_AEDAL